MRAVINNTAAAPPVDFSSESLRNTWLLRHIEAGTPIHVLMPQAALITAVTLEKLVPFAEPVPADEATLLMRQA